jgi:hypothetical protein
LSQGGSEAEAVPARVADWPPLLVDRRPTLYRGRVGGRAVEVGYAVVPVPRDRAAGLLGVDRELAGDLEALGYVGD